jgi:hypothetical protein
MNVAVERTLYMGNLGVDQLHAYPHGNGSHARLPRGLGCLTSLQVQGPTARQQAGDTADAAGPPISAAWKRPAGGPFAEAAQRHLPTIALARHRRPAPDTNPAATLEIITLLISFESRERFFKDVTD